jgi:hypothetical protein
MPGTSIDSTRTKFSVATLDRAVFVRVKAPHCALTALGVSAIVAATAYRAGRIQLKNYALSLTT